MKPKNIDLANKCGSCCHFEPIEGTCSGYCLRNKYGKNVVCDPNHPYWKVQRSRMKCVDYNKKPMTNADHIRSMTDEELAQYFGRVGFCNTIIPKHYCLDQKVCSRECVVRWLKQPYKEDT